MIVSNFEIGVRRRPGAPQRTQYRLQVTNLAEKEIEFLAECHVAASEAASSLAAVGALVQARVASGATYWRPFRRRGQVFVLGLAFLLPPGGSTVYELGTAGDEEVTLLGHVVLRVPAARGEPGRLLATEQQVRPVPVLLAASREDYRGFYPVPVLDRDGGQTGRTSVGDWLTTQSIELSTGRAENEIEAEGFGGIGDVADFQRAWQAQAQEPRALAGALHLPEEERIPALLDLLAALERDDEGLGALNELLAEVNADVRVTPA